MHYLEPTREEKTTKNLTLLLLTFAFFAFIIIIRDSIFFDGDKNSIVFAFAFIFILELLFISLMCHFSENIIRHNASCT